MYQYDIRTYLFQDGFNVVENIGRNIKQRLLVLHNRQVIVRNDLEGIQHLIQHLTMLACNTNDCLYIPPCLQLVDQRTHFYCFRSSAENQHDLFHKGMRPPFFNQSHYRFNLRIARASRLLFHRSFASSSFVGSQQAETKSAKAV